MTPAQVFTAARVILLDFDGPIAHLFAASPARAVAADLAIQLCAAGIPLPEDAEAYGPTGLCAELMGRHRDQADTIEALLTAAETTAARAAEPTPGCDEMLTAAQRARRPVVIVSNNASEPIRAYLDQHQLAGYITDIVGRPHAAPERMKPDPWPLHETARRRHVTAAECVLIGDSDTDIDAANAAGSTSIGYANKPAMRKRFQHRRATAIVTDMHDLADALNHTAMPGQGALPDRMSGQGVPQMSCSRSTTAGLTAGPACRRTAPAARPTRRPPSLHVH